MKYNEDERQIDIEFDGYAEVLDYLSRWDFPLKDQNHRPASHRAHDSDFCGFTWKQALDMLTRGWPQGAAKMSQITETIKARISDKQQYGINFDVTGDFIDVGRYLTGEPESFGFIEMQNEPKENVDIIINVGAHGGISEQAIITRGAAISAIIDELQKTHFVTVKFVSYVLRSNPMPKNIKVIIPLNMQEEYSRDLLAFYTSNPAFLRRIIWGIREIAFGKTKLGAMGYPVDIRTDTDTLYFGNMENNQWEEESYAIGMIKNIINSYNKTNE